MMFLFKIFQMFFSPSVILLVFFILGLIFIKRKLGKVLLIVGVLLYYLLSITPVSDLILLPLENKYNPPYQKIGEEERLSEEIKSIDTIVLLTGGLKKEDLPLSSVLGESTLFRTIEAINLYFKLSSKPKIIISGTNPISSEKNEAYFIGKFMEKFNIPKENIILEEKSRNTYESAKEIKKIVNEKPFLLVTSAYHLPRSILIFKKFELNPIPAPCDYQSNFLEDYNIFDFFPNSNNLKKVDIALHEYLGILILKFPKIYEIL